jgi:hypothetical protein
MIDPLAETIRLANAQFERELQQTEDTLIDIGATGPEIEDMIGHGGYWRVQLEASRDAQIDEVRKWIMGEQVH